ncbi:GNAT family N-acetyltransferase [Pelotomaculum propionicicum]|uniref:GNAT family N-acetyltransferase n=1 Tax=Pelotomaculum propionicicum TaxID=258475 RepID=UPI003B81937C
MAVIMINDQALWDKFVDESPYGLLFHKWDFLHIIEKHTGYQLLPYGIYKGDLLIAVFPLFYKKIMGLKTLFSPPPMSSVPYLGFVMYQEYDSLKQDRKEEYLNIVAEDVNSELENISPNYIFISLDKSNFDTRPFIWRGYNQDTHFTYVVDLNRELDDIWNSFNSLLRKNIRKGRKLGLEILPDSDASNVYSMMKERYREKGMNVAIVSAQYLQDLLECFPNELKCYSVYAKGAEKAVQTNIIYDYKRCIMWIGGMSTGDLIGVNDYFVWEMIQRAKAAGYKDLEYLGANVKNLCKNRCFYNPSLELSFSLCKKDIYGKLGEWTYRNLIKKRWL